MNKVHIFLGTAASASQEITGYPVGERHAFLVFLRQSPDSDHDWAGAEALLNEGSWTNVTLEKAGTIGPESSVGDKAEMYQAALSKGGAIIIYTEVL